MLIFFDIDSIDYSSGSETTKRTTTTSTTTRNQSQEGNRIRTEIRTVKQIVTHTEYEEEEEYTDDSE